RSASLDAGPDPKARLVTTRADRLEQGGCLFPPPPERGRQIGGGQLAGELEDEPGQLAPSLVTRRQVTHVPLARQQVVRDRAPRAVLLDEVRVREHEPAVEQGQRLVDLLLREPGEVAELRPGQRSLRPDR